MKWKKCKLYIFFLQNDVFFGILCNFINFFLCAKRISLVKRILMKWSENKILKFTKKIYEFIQ